MAAIEIKPSATIEQDGKYLKLKLWFCRALYANVHEPRPGTPGDARNPPKPPLFDCEFLLPKDAPGANEIAKTIWESGKETYKGAKWKLAVISNADKEIADAREQGSEISEALAMKAGHWVIKANSAVDKPPKTRGIIYSGCYAHAIIAVSTYPAINGGLPGVKGYLNGVAFAADGERLGGARVDLDQEFGPAPEQAQNDDFGPEPARHSSNDDLPF